MTLTTRILPILILFLTSAICLGQSSYKGLTPGKSTRIDVERTFGKPVKAHSETLVEYRPRALTGKIYVQYREGSTVVERIEMLCQTERSTCDDLIKSLNLRLPNEPDNSDVSQAMGGAKWKNFYGSPRFIVTSGLKEGEENSPPTRLAFYSRELYEAAAAEANAGRTSASTSIWTVMNPNSSLDGTNLTYYRGTTAESCKADCERNPKCRGFGLIRAGFYNPADPPMCYLLSAVTTVIPHACCISGVKK